MGDERPISWKYLAAKPGSHYRQLFVKGTRIAARVLYGYFTPGEDWPGLTAEKIAEGFNLPVEAVREAIAYSQSDPPEIREDWEKDEALMRATDMSQKDDSTSRPLSPEDYAKLYLQ